MFTFMYKGFIKISNDGIYYPLSRITSLQPYNYSPTKTRINFDNDTYIVVEHTMMDTINRINKAKEK